jgi:hypothetical protein
LFFFFYPRFKNKHLWVGRPLGVPIKYHMGT